MEDEEIQKKGVVYVIHHVNAPVRETCLGLVILGDALSNHAREKYRYSSLHG
jgi:hypothetical protein